MTAPSTSLAAVRFGDLGVPPELTEALERAGITSPFPIQAATLPDGLAGRDVSGRAPTGAGKTLAFGLTVLSRMAEQPAASRKGRRSPTALILVPTRELAAQIETVIAPLARRIGAWTACIYGGVGYGKQLSALRGGVDILIACPGRLTDLVEQRAADLSRVEFVVVDEADRMADMGFLPAVRRLLDLTSPSRQTLLFSATLDGPVDRLIRDYQRDPVRHDVETDEADRGDVAHHFWRVESHDRIAVTTEAVTAHGPAVVFCRTKRGADRLAERLSHSGLSAAAIHGDRSQSQRDRALAAFKSGRVHVLVATDVAARGIHVDAVPLVVHFDPPNDATDYVHRSGRTGRAGADGTVLSLVGREHDGAVRAIQRHLGLEGGVSAPDVPGLTSRGGSRPTAFSEAHPGATGVRENPRSPQSSPARGGSRGRGPRPGARMGASARSGRPRGRTTGARRPD